MAEHNTLWVIDTSIVAAWFFTDEPYREQSIAVKSAVGNNPANFIVPLLFYSELVHVLARKSRRDLEFVQSALGLVISLGIRTIHPSAKALERMAYWSCRGMSGYDATFVALAEDLNGLWLTADNVGARLAGRQRATTLDSWVRSASNERTD